MPHLTVEEIIDFVSFDTLSDEAIRLAARVNEHIRVCPLCKEKVASFQLIYEELCRLGKAKEGRQSLLHRMQENDWSEQTAQELPPDGESAAETRKNGIAR